MSRYQLFFRVLLIIWLFWFSFAVLKEYRKARVTNRYEMIGMKMSEITVPFVLNKEDGRVWKFFMGNGTGFEQVPFFPNNTENELRQCKNDLAAFRELQVVERKYSDFDYYREDVVKLLNTSKSLTIEEAYKKAKENRQKLEK